MKKIINYCLIAIPLWFMACSDVLDKEPIDIISENVVWNDNRLAEAYLDQVLAEMVFMFSEVSVAAPSGNLNIATRLWYMHDFITMSDEARHSFPWYYTFSNYGAGLLDETGGFGELWLYPTIRKTNEFIENMETSSILEDQKTELIARARWARAMCYFAMVKRYGGVPLITRVQTIDEPVEDLLVSRDKEVDIYDFIISEMDEIFPLMKNTRGGYPTKWAAMALKSRAALYAASSASWGTEQIDGIVGISASEATRFWQASYNASDALINESGHSLYNKYPEDKVKNFRQLFVDDAGNPESIFAFQFTGEQGQGFDHGWDMFTGPQGFVAWAGNAAAPYLEMVEEFENQDGTPGTFDRAKYTSGLWTVEEMFANKEPRFFASIYTQGTPWQGSKVSNYGKLILPDGSSISSGGYNGVPAKGSSNFRYATGFGVLKYLDETKVNPGNWSSNTDWMVFRLGEIYLNQAEACLELGKTDEALILVNAIRERAGVALLTSIDREKVRHERKVELAFESHRWFDLRRWRTAVDEISRPFSGVIYSMDYNSYVDGTPKFKLEIDENIDGEKQKQFFEKHYYLPITPERISNNPNLAPENPGY